MCSVVLSGGGCIMGCNQHPRGGYGGVVVTGLGPPVVSSPLC